MEKEPLVSIIIVNWDGKKSLMTCLGSLRKKTAYSNYRVIIVDNGSTDGSSEYIREEFPWIDLITLNKNYGFSIGNNRGIAFALRKYDPRFVLLLNNDVEIIQENWLSKIVEITEKDLEIGIAGCRFLYPDGSLQNIGMKVGVKGSFWLDPNISGTLPEVFEVDAVYGACFLIRRDVIDRIGLLDEGFSPFFHEETDYCLRSKKAGYKNCTISSATVVHARSVSVSKVKSYYVIFVEKKNALRFMLLNLPLTWIMLRMPFEIAILLSVIKINRDEKGFPLKLRKGRELINMTKANAYAWLDNARHMREIVEKRRNRTKKLTFGIL
jgi:GT2 family glycosyltransferase